MDNKYILVIDEGTTGTRAVIFNRKAKIVASAYEEFTQTPRLPTGLSTMPWRSGIRR